jgi:hypothetical protein
LDDLEGKAGEVVLEVRFFPGAVNQALAGIGIIAGPLSEHKVIVLMKESSFTSAPLSSFWDIIPISETQLAKKLFGVRRGSDKQGTGSRYNFRSHRFKCYKRKR